jgi:DNA (cytosine-5)-methyltransferase 1
MINVADPIITTASFCSGVGWLDEGVGAGLEYFGLRHRTALLCEWEGYAAATLLARMEDASMEPAPIWCGDLGDIDFSPFRGMVDILVGGFPCQPFSTAGLRHGHADERNLWPAIIRAIQQLGPSIVFLENVPGILSTRTIHHRPDLLAHFAALDAAIESEASPKRRWLGRSHRDRFYRRLLRECGVSAFVYVKASLEALGLTVEDPLFVTAESVGASHRRERVFIMAHAERGGGWINQQKWGSDRRTIIGRDGKAVDDSRGAAGGRDAGTIPGTKAEGDRERRVDGRGSERSEFTSADLAEPASRGQRELRKSPGGDGQSDGCDEVLGNAEHGSTRNRDTPEEGSEKVARRGRLLGPSDAGGVLANARCQRGSCIIGRKRRTKQSKPENQNSEAMANADESGLQGGLRGTSHAQCATTQRSGQGFFAPPPGADWGSIPEALWPAIEPGFRVLVDGEPMVLDESRADQLRCAGNGCVALQAAVAFVELARRAGMFSGKD